MIRSGVAWVLSKNPAFTVVGEVRNGRDAIRMAMELVPDVLLLDAGMPGLAGLQVAEALGKSCPSTRIVVLSAFGTPGVVFRMLRAGATGYVLKSGPVEDIVRATERVHAGNAFFSPPIATMVSAQIFPPEGATEAMPELSEREQEVLIYISDGLSNREIAEKMKVAVRTVETHRERLMQKLQVRGIAGLTRFAIANGFVSLPP